MITIATTGLEQYMEGGKGRIKLLLAGAPGSGKTRFAAFAPKVIYADTEDGLMSVADRRVPYATIKSTEDMTAMLDLLEAECKKPEAQRRWTTFVVDTLDAYQRLVIESYLRRMRKDAMSGWEDWGYLDSKMTGLLGRLFLLDMNVIVICHVKDTKINDIDATVLKLKGDVRDQIPADFDFVGLMELEWGMVGQGAGAKRGLIRSIRWEPTPMAPWLKCRGGALTVTPVVGAPSDWAAIQDGLSSQLAALQASEVIEQVETAEPEPFKVAPGGPVRAPGKPPAANAVAKTATAETPAPPPTPARAVPPAPAVVTPPPPVATPVTAAVEATVHPQQALETVASVLGGKVIPESVSTPVAGPQTGDGAEAGTPALTAREPVETGPAPSSSIPESGQHTITVACGSGRYTGTDPIQPGVGCGQPLTVGLDEGRVTSAGEGQKADLVEIAGLKERAFLHNACFAEARKKATASVAK